MCMNLHMNITVYLSKFCCHRLQKFNMYYSSCMQVVRALDCITDFLDLNNGAMPGESVLFDSAEQSAEIRLFQRMAFGSQEYGSDFSQASWRGNGREV